MIHTIGRMHPTLLGPVIYFGPVIAQSLAPTHLGVTIFRNHKSESNRSGKITFSNMAELNLLIRKLIQNGNRDSAIQLIETIIQRIEAKNKVNNHK